ncbi:MAG: protein kinase [Deltaproteobacteria bacterium]|nr:protein kinase [Deltaproteobacteria bacterium]
MNKGPGRLGTILGGAYRLERLIGEGGMGSVYEASHTRLPRRFAVKLLNADVLSNREVFERFQREAEIASSLGDDHIVQVVDFNYTEDGVPYMVLELLVGEDLADRLESRGRMSLAQTATILEQISGALEVAHQHGIVHRDLKPQNLFLVRNRQRDDFVKILDFGISKVLHAPSLATKTGAVFGTPYYMSPEQAEGRQSDIDARTDIFAIGAIMYECLAGRRAFDANSLPSALYQVCHLEPPALREAAPEVPPSIEQVLSFAMAKRRDERYPDIRTMCDDFLRAANGQPTLASQRSAPAPGPHPSGSVRTVSMGSQPPESRPPSMPVRPPSGPPLGPGSGGVAGSGAWGALPAPTGPVRPSNPMAPTTMGGATGESLPPDMTMSPPRSRKGAMIAGIAIVAALGVAAFVIMSRGKGDKKPGPVPPQQPVAVADAAPRPAVIPIDAAPVVVIPVDAAIPDAAPIDAPPVVPSPVRKDGSIKPPPKGSGTLILSADPWADIYIDGKPYKSTPNSVKLPAGKHKVVLRNDDLDKKVSFTVTIEADKTTSVSKTMK